MIVLRALGYGVKSFWRKHCIFSTYHIEDFLGVFDGSGSTACCHVPTAGVWDGGMVRFVVYPVGSVH